MISKILKAVIVFTAFLTIGSTCLSSAVAGNGKSVEVLDQMQARIEKQNKAITNLQQRIKEADGILKEAFDVRLGKAWMRLILISDMFLQPTTISAFLSSMGLTNLLISAPLY